MEKIWHAPSFESQKSVSEGNQGNSQIHTFLPMCRRGPTHIYCMHTQSSISQRFLMLVFVFLKAVVFIIVLVHALVFVFVFVFFKAVVFILVLVFVFVFVFLKAVVFIPVLVHVLVFVFVFVFFEGGCVYPCACPAAFIPACSFPCSVLFVFVAEPLC